jgi:asparagine N-glycosylation enzyme membrane subunit Stt3
MTGRQVAVIAVVIGLVVAVTVYFFYSPSSFGQICTSGPYDAKLVSPPPGSELNLPASPMNYTQNGVTYAGYYASFMDGSLSWLKSNTPSSATVLSWWDYGNMIVACAGRSAVVRDPSQQAVSLGIANSSPQMAPNATLADVATALTTTNSGLTLSIMHKYGAGYLLVVTEDGGQKAPSIFKVAGLDSSLYVTPSGTTFTSSDWTALGKQTTICRLLDGQTVPGLTKTYSDSNVLIFELS